MSWSRTSRAVVAATLLLGTLTGVAAAQPDDATGPDNRAHLDLAATDEALKAAKSISTELFTYSYTDIEGHRKRFAELTTGNLRERYEELFGQIATSAAAQQYRLASEVTDAAVRLLTRDEAQVLVFLTQTGSSATTPSGTTAKAMYYATLTKVGGEWKASAIDLFEDQ